MTIVGNEFQSQPCVTIYNTHDETLEQSSCCHLGEQIKTHTILVEKVEVLIADFSPPMTIGQLVVTIVGNEFQSQPCVIIYNTHYETLEQSSCCHLGEQIKTHTILVGKI